MDKTQRTIVDLHRLLDLIRVYSDEQKTTEAFRSVLSLSRPTVEVQLRKLEDADIITQGKTEPGKRYQIRPDVGYFLGISCGTEHLRAVICDLMLNPVPFGELRRRYGLSFDLNVDAVSPSDGSDTCFSCQTPTGFLKLQDLISDLVFRVLQCRNAGFPLMGIGFAVTGPVNYAKKRWVSAPRISSIVDVGIEDLIGNNNYEKLPDDVFLSIDNNAKATAVSEYQFLYQKNCGRHVGDIASLYVGSGVGLGMVMGRRLIRGTDNYAGEISNLIYNAPKLFDGGYAEDGDQLLTIEERLNQINNSTSNDIYPFLAFLINQISCFSGTERMILTGHSIEKTNVFLNAIRDKRTLFTSPITKHSCKIDAGRNDPSTAAIGAAIEAYFCMCAAKGEDDSLNSAEERTNLSTDISWLSSD